VRISSGIRGRSAARALANGRPTRVPTSRASSWDGSHDGGSEKCGRGSPDGDQRPHPLRSQRLRPDSSWRPHHIITEAAAPLGAALAGSRKGITYSPRNIDAPKLGAILTAKPF